MRTSHELAPATQPQSQQDDLYGDSSQQPDMSQEDDESPSQMEVDKKKGPESSSRKRRAASSDQEESGEANVSAKAKGKRRRIDNDDADKEEDEDEEEQDEDDMQVDGPPRRNTRKSNGRTQNGDASQSNGNEREGADDEDSEEEEGVEVEEGLIVKTRKRPATKVLVRGEDDFVPGSIVRIKMHDFLTYRHAEFGLGPRLNLVIGPNGTGKSSIVCGIALGLGFPTKVLGRAKDLSHFVRTGKKSAWTQIELKGPHGKPNVVIKRSFQRANKQSVWELDGKKVTAQIVHDTVHDLGIQVNNLCAFLPQDKVASFAGMDSKQVLQATMETANEVRLPGWHAKLVKTELRLVGLNETLEQDEKKLNKVESRIAELEEIVTASNERKRLEEKLDRLNGMKIGKMYNIAREDVNRLKRERAELKRRKQNLELKNQPLTDLKEDLNTRRTNLGGKDKKAKTDVKAAYNHARDQRKKLEVEAERAENIEEELKGLKDDEKNRKNKEIAILEKIRVAEQKLGEMAQPRDPRELSDKKAKLRIEEGRIKDLNAETDQAIRQIQDQSKWLNDKLKQQTQHLQGLSDVRRKRIHTLGTREPNCKFAMSWIQQNRHLFEKEVYFPPAVEIQVTDIQYFEHVEACLSFAQLRTFIAQTKKDYDILNRINDEGHKANGQRVRINTHMVTADEIAQLDSPRRASIEFLKECGFDGYAIDVVQAPDAVLAYCHFAKLHETPISRKTGDCERAQTKGLTQFMHMEAGILVSNSIRISSYGSKAPVVTTKPTTNAQFFNENVDKTGIDRANKGIEEIRFKQGEFEKEVVRLHDEKAGRKADSDQLQAALTKVEKELQEIKATAAAIQRQKSQLNMSQTELQALRKAPPVQDKRQKLKEQLAKSVFARYKIFIKSSEYFDTLQNGTSKSSLLCLAGIQNQSNLNYIEGVIADRKVEQRAVSEQYDEAKVRFSKKKHESEDLGKEFGHNMTMMAEKHHHENWHKLISAQVELKTLDEIETEALETENDLKLQPDIDHQAEARLERYQGDRKTYLADVEKGRARKERLMDGYNEAKNGFEPALTSLVEAVSEKFGAALQGVHVVGEVRINRGNGYGDWALEIRVKFRDNEELQVLDSKRQSGGERSLTTIMYLMSLMELSRTPFSLVDEINQGMDQKNERAVHDQLVRATCEGSSGQYFLITPKLLTGLSYDPRMKVLCINNGDWLPPLEKGKLLGDLKSVLRDINARRAQ